MLKLFALIVIGVVPLTTSTRDQGLCGINAALNTSDLRTVKLNSLLNGLVNLGLGVRDDIFYIFNHREEILNNLSAQLSKPVMDPEQDGRLPKPLYRKLRFSYFKTANILLDYVLGELVWLDQGNAERLDLIRGILKELKQSVKRLTDFGDTSFEWKLFRVIIRSYEKNIETVSLLNEKSNKPFDVLFQIDSALRLILETFRDS